MSYAAQVLSRRSPRRRHVVGLLLISAFLLWSVLWGGAAYQLNKKLDAWTKAPQGTGLELSFASRDTGGTPWSVRIHLENVEVKHAGRYNLHAKEAVLYANIWDWKTITTKLRDGIQGQLNNLPFTADHIKLNFDSPDQPPLTYREAGLSLWVIINNLQLTSEKPLPFGNQIDTLSFALDVMGETPDFSNPASIKTWNEASGVLEFNQLDIVWGPLLVSAKGTLGLNPSLQPEGAFSGKVEGLDEAVDKLVAQGSIEKRQESLLRASLSVLSRPSGMVNGGAPIVPITVQNGGLYLGPVKIMDMMPIIWAAPDSQAITPQQQPDKP